MERFTLAARYLAFPDRFLTNDPDVFPGGKRVAVFYSSTGELIKASDSVPDPFGPFPYGAAVEQP
jgi:hypothetical protein